jgi:hypothetical protein
VFTINGGVVS